MFHTKYIAPPTLDDFLSCLHQYGDEASVIAGGTDLVPQMRLGRCNPKVLVDPLRLPLTGLSEMDGYIHLGARLTHSQVISSHLINQSFPALVSACQLVGGPPVRNRGTLAGNLANASPAADSALPLLVYDAQVIAASVGGERKIPLDKVFLAPGKSCLACDEFVREIRIPRTSDRTSSVFLKLGNRNAMAISVASVAVRLSLDTTGNVSQARIALGSVAPTPIRAFEAEAILASHPLSQDCLHQVAKAAMQAATPISDLRASAEYRRKMVQVLTRRAVEQAWAQLTSGDADD